MLFVYSIYFAYNMFLILLELKTVPKELICIFWNYGL